MKFAQHYRSGTPAISFELFPPRTEQGLLQLKQRLPKLKALQPAFITVTYGAFGSNQECTLEIARQVLALGIEAAHHLTCVGASRDQITVKVRQIEASGIQNIVALRGDPPADAKEFRPVKDGFRYANELVSHLRSLGDMGLAVAGYPEKHVEAPDLDTDILNLKRKVESGADVVITQLFYDNSDFYRFVDRCRKVGIDKPIIPGLLPILSLHQIRRITKMCGASIPPDLLQKLERAENREQEIHRVGIEHTIEQAQDLLEQGVPGIHFYVLNRYFHIAEIMAQLD